MEQIITLTDEWMTKRASYRGFSSAVREFLHNSRSCGTAFNAHRQWTDIKSKQVNRLSEAHIADQVHVP